MNYELLEKRIIESGLKRKHISEHLGLTYQGLRNKLTGKNDFTRKEVATLSELLGITEAHELEEIFLTNG